MALDRLERVLPRAPDVLCLLLGAREELLRGGFGFVPGCDKVRVAVLGECPELLVDPPELRAAGLVHRRFQDIHHERGQALPRQRVLVHEVVLVGLPLGHVLRAVLAVVAVLEVSLWQDGLAGLRAIEHRAEAEAGINSRE